MNQQQSKAVLILGANSDVAKEALTMYLQKGFHVMAASRSTSEIDAFIRSRKLAAGGVSVLYFDATAFDDHASFYASLPFKPNIILYAAGFQIVNEAALLDWQGTFQMMKVHYCGAVSILNIIAMDAENPHLERIIGMSSLSGVRGRKSNFIYGSTKSAFTQYLAGLRQYLSSKNVIVNVIIAGYIRSKMTSGLELTESLMMEPSYIASSILNARRSFRIVPGFKWKLIYLILKSLPENLAARLP